MAATATTLQSSIRPGRTPAAIRLTACVACEVPFADRAAHPKRYRRSSRAQRRDNRRPHWRHHQARASGRRSSRLARLPTPRRAWRLFPPTVRRRPIRFPRLPVSPQQDARAAPVEATESPWCRSPLPSTLPSAGRTRPAPAPNYGRCLIRGSSRPAVGVPASSFPSRSSSASRYSSSWSSAPFSSPC